MMKSRFPPPLLAAVAAVILLAGVPVAGVPVAASPAPTAAQINSGMLQTSSAPYIGNTGACCARSWANSTVSFVDISGANATEWSETLIKEAGDAGNIAVGAWWGTFPDGSKYPMAATTIRVSVHIDVTRADITRGHWARIALAAAFYRYGPPPNVLYTELDLWDGPLTYPNGAIGGIVYAGPGVVEYKYAQLAVGSSAHLSVDLTPYMEPAWGSLAVTEGLLESVYVVIEAGVSTVGAMAAQVSDLFVYAGVPA